MKNVSKTIIGLVLCVAIAAFSIVVAAPKAKDIENYDSTLETLEMLKGNAALMSATTVVAATAVAAVPGDVTTPLANKLADVAGYSVIIYTALVIEKYIVTLLGWLTWQWIIPIVCALFAISLIFKRRGTENSNVNRAKTLGMKFVVTALILWLTVPVSTSISQKIYDDFDDARQQKLEQLEEEYGDAEASLMSKVKMTVAKGKDYGKAYIDIALEWAAVLIAITAVIPLAMLFFGLWVAKQIFGLNISVDPRYYAKEAKASKLLNRKKDAPQLESGE